MKLATSGVHQLKTDRTIRKVSFRMVSMRHQSTQASRYVHFWTVQVCFYLRLRSKTALGIHRLKADPTVQRVSHRTVPVLCGTRGTVQQKTSETRIQSKAMLTLHTLRIGCFQSSVSNPVPRALLSMITHTHSTHPHAHTPPPTCTPTPPTINTHTCTQSPTVTHTHSTHLHAYTCSMHPHILYTLELQRYCVLLYCSIIDVLRYIDIYSKLKDR